MARLDRRTGSRPDNFVTGVRLLYNTLSMLIRPLTEDDAPAFREVRLRALQDHSEAFSSSANDFAQRPLSHTAERLRNEGQHPDSFTLGAFIAEELVGMMGLVRDQAEKLQHKAFIWGVYVTPEARQQGVARALMLETIARARTLVGLEQLYLGVAAFNTHARSLYLALGFEIYGTEPRAMKVEGRFVDEDLMLLRL